MTYASLKLSFILAKKKTGFKLHFLYVFSVEILQSKSETFMKKKNMFRYVFLSKKKRKDRNLFFRQNDIKTKFIFHDIRLAKTKVLSWRKKDRF
mgnify:CR=1 FL=1